MFLYNCGAVLSLVVDRSGVTCCQITVTMTVLILEWFSVIYPWQEQQWQQCQQAISQQRLHHALMLTGQAGLGKLDFSEHLAALQLCETSTETACGQCRGCELFQAGTHPDFYRCQPQEKSRVIKVDQIRQLIADLSTTAQRSQGQVVIIEPAEGMNVAAANALLKTLEEPSGDVLLILVAHRTLTIPATILSRCQRLHFAVQQESTVKSWLAQQAEQTTALELAWRLSAGAPLLALTLLAEDCAAQRDLILNHMGLIHQSRQDPTSIVDQLTKMDMVRVLQMMLSVCNDLIACQQQVGLEHLCHQDQIKKVEYLARRLCSAGLLDFQRLVLDKVALWQRSQSINPQLLLEYVLLKWYEIAHVG